MRGVITAFRLGQGGLAHQAAALAVERTARQLAAASAVQRRQHGSEVAAESRVVPGIFAWL
jgi:hypothetical protein